MGHKKTITVDSDTHKFLKAVKSAMVLAGHDEPTFCQLIELGLQLIARECKLGYYLKDQTHPASPAYPARRDDKS